MRNRVRRVRSYRFTEEEIGEEMITLVRVQVQTGGEKKRKRRGKTAPQPLLTSP